jgi:hypothetical protein
MPLTVFEACFINKEYKALLIEGTCPDEVLESVWLTIYSEYCELTDDSQVKGMIKLQKKILSLKMRISAITAIIKMLWLIPDDKLISYLKDTFKCRGDFNYKENKDQYHRDLTAVINMTNGDAMQLNSLNKQLEKYSGLSDGKPVSKSFIDDMLVYIQECIKVFIVKEQCSVSMFCSYLKRVKKITERANAR